MNDHFDDKHDASDSRDSTGPSDSGRDPNTIRGTYQHTQISARVPEHVSVGVFSTGAIILTTNTEFVIDFLIRMGRPHQVVARVILPPAVVPQVINALKQAIERWQSHFGDMPTVKSPASAERKPSLDEIYGELKMAETIMSGTYANGVMISFSPAEFSFDFLTNFFPKSAVSQRVYLSVPQVPRFKQALEQTFEDFQQRVRQMQQNQQNQLDLQNQQNENTHSSRDDIDVEDFPIAPDIHDKPDETGRVNDADESDGTGPNNSSNNPSNDPPNEDRPLS